MWNSENNSAIFYLSSKLQGENYYYGWCTNLKIPTIYSKCTNCDRINISQMTIFEVGQIIIEEQRVQLDEAQKGRKRGGREGGREKDFVCISSNGDCRQMESVTQG